jgi:anti-sigma factor RsiW
MTGFVCWIIKRRLDAYQDGELGPAARAKTAAHLARCKGCASELAALGRLRTAFVGAEIPDPGEGVWNAFWPQVRTRLTATPEPKRRIWMSVAGHPRIAFGSAVAVAAVAVLAVLAPWAPWLTPFPSPEAPRVVAPVVPPGTAPAPASGSPTTPVPVPGSNVVVHAVETEAPDSSVMVFTNEEPGVTVVWVFGLERT